MRQTRKPKAIAVTRTVNPAWMLAFLFGSLLTLALAR